MYWDQVSAFVKSQRQRDYADTPTLLRSLANAELVILIARLFYNLKVSAPCDFKGLVEREHFTVSYAPHGVPFNFEAK